MPFAHFQAFSFSLIFLSHILSLNIMRFYTCQAICGFLLAQSTFRTISIFADTHPTIHTTIAFCFFCRVLPLSLIKIRVKSTIYIYFFSAFFTLVNSYGISFVMFIIIFFIPSNFAIIVSAKKSFEKYFQTIPPF